MTPSVAFEVPFRLRRLLRGNRQTPETLVHRPLHRRPVLGERERIAEQTGGLLEPALAERDLARDSGVEIGTVAAKTSRLGVHCSA